jgi:hypothetical protein
MLPERWGFVHPRPETVSDSHGSEASAYAVLWRDKVASASASVHAVLARQNVDGCGRAHPNVEMSNTPVLKSQWGQHLMAPAGALVSKEHATLNSGKKRGIRAERCEGQTMKTDPPSRVSDSKNATTSIAEAASKVIENSPCHLPGAGDAR